MSKIVPKLDNKGLREFGFVTATIIALLFGLFFPVVIFDQTFPDMPLVFRIALGLASVSLILPILLKPLYIVWMYIGFVLGWINTRIILGLVFFIIFTPVALFLKLLRKDPMHRKITALQLSYRKPSIEPPKHQMEKPF